MYEARYQISIVQTRQAVQLCMMRNIRWRADARAPLTAQLRQPPSSPSHDDEHNKRGTVLQRRRCWFSKCMCSLIYMICTTLLQSLSVPLALAAASAAAAPALLLVAARPAAAS